MKLDTAINHKARANRLLIDLWRQAKTFHLTHDEILKRKAEIFDSVSHCPRWVRAELKGYDHALFDAHWSSLEFCYLLKGVLYSTHRQSDKPNTGRLYNKNLGAYLSKHGKGTHYYKGTDKPFTLTDG